MRKFLSILMLFIFIQFFCVIKVEGFTTKETTNTCSGSYTIGSHTRDNCVIEDTDDNRYFCLEIAKKLSGGTSHSKVSTIEGEDQACGILAAMNAGYISAPTTDTTYYYTSVSNSNYYSIQKLIWDYENHSGSCSGQTTNSLSTGTITVKSTNIEMWKETIDGKEYYTAKIENIKTTNLNSTTYSITKNLPSGSIVSTSKSGTNVSSSDNGTLYIRIPVDEVTETSNFTIALSGSYNSKKTTTITPIIEVYKHNNNRQKLGKIGLKRQTSYEAATASKSITLSVTVPSEYGFTIKKIDQNGTPVSGVSFTLDVNGTILDGVTNSLGTLTFTDLPALTDGNTYRLTEKVKSGYDTSNAIIYWDYQNKYGRGIDGSYALNGESYIYWDINTLSSDRVVFIENEKNCITEFKAIDQNNFSERLRLYNTYKDEEGNNLNNLLNLNVTNASTACSYTSCNQSLSTGCLALSNSQTLEKDFSCYDFTVSVSGSAASVYCFSNFSLQNLFSGSPSNGTYQFGISHDIFAGRLINQNKDNAEAATLSLDIYCYSTADVGNSLTINKKYSDFIKEVTFKGTTLDYVNKNDANIKLTDSIVLTKKESKYGGYLYSLNSISNFNFKKVYSHLLNGKLEYNLTSNLKDYNYLGYGIVSNLDDESGKTIGIEYTVKLGSAITSRDNYKEDNNSTDGTTYVNSIYSNSNECTYKVKNEITTTDDPNNPDELNLEFRLIDGTVSDSSQSSTINLFPGKDGTGRKIGSNWCKENITACASNDKLTYDDINVDPVINGINSYGIRPSDGSTYRAKYTIELDASTIDKIKKYNDNVDYDEYDLTCDDKGNCEKSKFLMDTSIWNSDNLEIISEESARRR